MTLVNCGLGDSFGEGFKQKYFKNPNYRPTAPVFIEFNPTAWNKNGCFEKFVALLKSVSYSHFIWVKEMSRLGEEKIYPTEKLLDWKNSNAGFGELGDIFLIKT